MSVSVSAIVIMTAVAEASLTMPAVHNLPLLGMPQVASWPVSCNPSPPIPTPLCTVSALANGFSLGLNSVRISRLCLKNAAAVFLMFFVLLFFSYAFLLSLSASRKKFVLQLP